MRKIVLITDFTGYGGTKTYFLNLVNYLLRKGYHLEVYLASRSSLTNQEYNDFSPKPIAFHYLPKILLTNNIFLKRLRINKLLHFFYLFFSIHDLPEKVMVSTGHPFNFLSAAWIWGKRYVYIQHTYPQGSPSKFTGLISPIRSIWFFLMSKREFLFVTVSKTAKRMIHEFVSLEQKKFPVEVVYNTCPIGFIQHKLNDSQAIVTIGHLEKWKNPEFWLQVALTVVRQNGDACFIWAGTGSLFEEISSQIPMDFQGRVRLAGYVEKVGELLSSASIYFQPSLVENHSISVVEAMAQSLPCVVSDRGGLPESVEDGITGYVVELDVDKTAKIILQLVQNPDVAMKMGQAGYEKYRQNFTPEIWEKNMDRLLFNTAQA